MLIALTPPAGDRGWRFHVVNDGDAPIDELVVERVDLEGGGGGEALGDAFGPVAPGASVAVHDEPGPAVPASITLRVREGAVEARWFATAGPGERATLASSPSPPGTIELDARGVRRWHDDGTAASARWDRLVAVEIVTTGDGPAQDDVFWVLHEDAGGCVIPASAAEADALVARLTAWPGFDHAAMIDAMASAGDARFLVWRRAAPDA